MIRRGKALFVLYNHPAAYPPVMNAVRAMRDRGWTVTVLGIRQYDFPPVALEGGGGVTWRLLPACRPGLLQKLHYGLAALRALAFAMFWRPTVVFVSDPIAAPIGLLLSSFTRRAIVYHEHDTPRESASRTMRWMIEARRRLAGRAFACVLPNRARAAELRRTVEVLPHRVLCVWNCPATAEVPALVDAPAAAAVTLYYHGVINPERLPPVLVEALARCPHAMRLIVVGNETVGSAGYMERFLAAAAAAGVRERIEWRGYVPRHELLANPVRGAVGLALIPTRSDDPNLRQMLGASNKAFDYLAMGIPILVSNLPDWEATFVEPGFARSCDPSSVDSLVATFEWLVAHRDRLAAMGRAGQARILSTWNYEEQMAPLLTQLETANLEAPPGHGRDGRLPARFIRALLRG